jgi:hypothetical protein
MVEMTVLFSFLIKLIFLSTILLQVMLWPTVSSICFTCIYGLIGIVYYFSLPSGKVLQSFLDPGVYVFRDEKRTRNFILMFFMALHFAIYFILFISHEVDILPAVTLWMDKSFIGNYSGHSYAPLPVDVTSDISKNMRSNPFIWSKSLKLQAPLIIGSIPTAGPDGGDLICGNNNNNNNGNNNTNYVRGLGYKCFGKIWKTRSPVDSEEIGFVPLSSELYNVDVMITPGRGLKCGDLEVYRLIVNNEKRVVSPMDYPASTVPISSAARSPLTQPACNLFNGTSGLCLQIQHTFSQSKYVQEVSKLCDKFDQKLIFRLPERSSDIDPESGRHTLDILLVSETASNVEIHASWKKKNQSDWFLFYSIWNQVVDSDQLQGWRDSSEDAAVFFKFAIAVIPLAITWYYLSAEYIFHYLQEGQITFLTVFIQMPTILLFLSMGAWLPMAGCIVCVLAVNYEVKKTNNWVGALRPSLLFLTAVCNSIQFAWILALVGEAGWNSFYYALTLDQLYSISYKFIITNQSSPTWIALMLPVIILTNASFLLGSAICVVLETMSKRRTNAPNGV